MPRGPLPKDESKKERRNAPTFETTHLEGKPSGAPTLTGRSKLRRETCRWWDTWKDSPQAKLFLATDWNRLLALVPMVDAYFGGELKHLAEIRQNESLLGATPMDRLRLRWRMRDADKEAERGEAKPAKTGRPLTDPRERLKVVSS